MTRRSLALARALDIDRRDLVAWMRKAELHQRGVRMAKRSRLGMGLWLCATAAPVERADGRITGRGEAFVAEGVRTMRSVIDERLAPMAAQLDDAETRRSKAFVDSALGQRRIYVNECHGLCYPSCRPTNSSMTAISMVRGAVRRPTRSAPSSADLWRAKRRPYVRMESGIGENKWSGLDNSLDWGAIFLWEYGEANRPVLERCPETAKVLESLPVSYIPGRRRAPSSRC